MTPELKELENLIAIISQNIEKHSSIPKEYFEKCKDESHLVAKIAQLSF